MVFFLKDKIYIFEFKIDSSSDAALDQIKRNKYYQKYMGRNQKIALIGVNFYTREKVISDRKEEYL